MPAFPLTRLSLSTGVELDVAIAGDREKPAVILLHGFPESHRTWRHVIPLLARDHFVIAPDQRGFARSSKPPRTEDYAAPTIIDDMIALADALGIARFALVGHDWGGAIAWGAALRHPERVARLAILNAPHPLIFQRTLIDDPAQRAASQYIRAFRNPAIEAHVERIGLEAFFDGSFASHVDMTKIGDERGVYLDQWGQPGALTAMLNWYRAASVIVPEIGESAERPAFLDAPFPRVTMPTLVLWGMRDSALLPCQIEGLDELVDDLSLVTVDAGHFLTWEAADAVNAALAPFLAEPA